MAAPTLLSTGTLFGSGTSVSVASNFTSPVNGNYRLMVLDVDDRASNNAPISVTVPVSWELIYASPRGRSTKRIWVYGQTWSNPTTNPTVNVTFNVSTPYAITVAKFIDFTRNDAVVAWPGTAFGGAQYATGQFVDAPGMFIQADAMRLDFWFGYYVAGLSSGTLHITPPVSQTSTTLAKASGDAGYATRVSYETTVAKGYIPSRHADMTNASVNGVLSLAIGGWKDVIEGTQTPMALGRSSVGHKTTGGNSSHAMSLASITVGGRTAEGATETALGLQQLTKRVFLTYTDMALAGECVASRTGVLFTDTKLGLIGNVAGTHIAGSVASTTTLKLVSTSTTRIGGGGAPASVVDEYTDQYQPPLRPLRFMYQEIRTGRWLNWDVPLVEPEITWTLSGPTTIRGRAGPEDIEAIRGIEAWGTWLHVEESGLIRASAIMQPLSIQGDDLMIEAVGVHGYAVGIQFESEFSAIQIDAAEAMRQLWAYLQFYPDAKLGVTLDPTNTGRKLGDPARIELEIDSATGAVVYQELVLEAGTGAGLHWTNQKDVPTFAWAKLLTLGYPLYQDEDGQLVMLVTPNDFSMATTGLPAVSQVDAETGELVWYTPKYTYVEAKPYEIAWWNDIDVGREIENLVKETPFDFAETPRWADDQLDVQQHISIGYPRLGTKRFDLRFAEDENLFAAVILRESPGFYASQVIVRGAGEGRASIRAQAGGNNSRRVRRVASLTDKTITTRERAGALATEELWRRLAAYTISEITIDATHDNAPMGSFTVGDDILVQANLPYYGEVQLWHRILAYTWRPDANEVVLALRRSEQFNYGRVLPN